MKDKGLKKNIERQRLLISTWCSYYYDILEAKRDVRRIFFVSIDIYVALLRYIIIVRSKSKPKSVRRCSHGRSMLELLTKMKGWRWSCRRGKRGLHESDAFNGNTSIETRTRNSQFRTWCDMTRAHIHVCQWGHIWCMFYQNFICLGTRNHKSKIRIDRKSLSLTNLMETNNVLRCGLWISKYVFWNLEA